MADYPHSTPKVKKMNIVNTKLTSYYKGNGNTAELAKAVSAECEGPSVRVSFGAYTHIIPNTIITARFLMDVCKEHKVSKKDIWNLETLHEEFNLLEAGFLCEKHKNQNGKDIKETPVEYMKNPISANQYKEFLIRKNKDSGVTAYWTLAELLDKPEKELTKAILLDTIKDIVANWIKDEQDMESLKKLQDKENETLRVVSGLKELGLEKIIISSIPDQYKGLVVMEKAKEVAQVLPTKGFLIVSTGFDMDTMKVSVEFKKVIASTETTFNL
jgi:hypothetical protein